MTARVRLLLREAPGSTLRGTLLLASATPICCGFTLGLTYGNIGGVLTSEDFLAHTAHPSDSVLQIVAAALQIGCIFGAIAAIWALDRLGRRPSILIALSAVAFGTVVVALPGALPGEARVLLIAGRLLTGIGGGLACAAVPLHASECAPAAYRGAIDASFALAIECGIAVAYVLNWSLLIRSPYGCARIGSQPAPLAQRVSLGAASPLGGGRGTC